MNADGLPDLAALVHDKVVAYLQQSKEPEKASRRNVVERETDAAAEKEKD